jgi:predicted enzyme related to lactoylglutathione lyase
MPRVIHFEIHANDPERAIRFYGESFGWSFRKYDGPMPYWLVRTGPEDQPGIDGGLLQRQAPLDGEGIAAYVCTVDVPDLDAALETVTGAGAHVVWPKNPIPGVGWLAYAKDPEGNVFGMLQEDPEAPMPEGFEESASQA